MQFRGLMVLVVVCLVSLLGLVSLGVPQPMTVTFTSTSVVIITGFQSATFTNPLITTFPYYCLFGFSCPTNRGTETIMATETWTSSYFSCCVTWYVNRTTGVSPYVYTDTEVLMVATPVTVTAGPIVSTSVTTSTFTSSLTQTGHSTEQLSPIRTNSTNQMIATALILVLVVSLLMSVRVLRKKEAKQAALTQFTKPSK